MARLMELMEQWGQWIIDGYKEKPWTMYLTMAIIGIGLLIQIIYLLTTAYKTKEK